MTSSGSWMKTGPKSSISARKTKDRDLTVLMITPWAPLFVNIQFSLYYSPIWLVQVHNISHHSRQKRQKKHGVRELETTKQAKTMISAILQQTTDFLFYFTRDDTPVIHYIYIIQQMCFSNYSNPRAQFTMRVQMKTSQVKIDPLWLYNNVTWFLWLKSGFECVTNSTQ